MELNALCLDKSGKLETAEQEDKKSKGAEQEKQWESKPLEGELPNG